MSDQDFFFDEEEDAKPKAASKATSGSKKPVPSKAAAPAPAGTFFAQNVSMTVAALMAVIALLLGVIIGIVIPTGSTTVPPVTSSAGTDAAPVLSDDQLNSGELPAGHPDISGMATGSAGATGSADTTAN